MVRNFFILCPFALCSCVKEAPFQSFEPIDHFPHQLYGVDADGGCVYGLKFTDPSVLLCLDAEGIIVELNDFANYGRMIEIRLVSKTSTVGLIFAEVQDTDSKARTWWKSTDGGITWDQAITFGINTRLLSAQAFAEGEDGQFVLVEYQTQVPPSARRVMRSTDYGETCDMRL